MVQIVTVFSLFVIIISLDDRLKNIVFTYIPSLFISFVLCFYIIRNEKDLNRLIIIFVWQAALISLFIVLERYTNFSATVWLMDTVPNYDVKRLQWKLFRSEHYLAALNRGGGIRAIGIDGSAVQSAYRLSFLFPLTLYYAFSKPILQKPWRCLPVVLTIVAIYFLFTRAAFIGVIFSIISLFAAMVLLKVNRRLKKRKRKIIRKLLFGVVLCVMFICFFKPAVIKSLHSTVYKSVDFSKYSNVSLSAKFERIPVAIDHFKKRPLRGYGSPLYVLSTVMKGDDLPSPFIYLLAGGIFLFLIFMTLIFYLSFSIFRLTRKRELSFSQKEILTYALSAFIGGTIVVFSNACETHFMIMYMLYISIYKVYIHKNVKRKVSTDVKVTKNWSNLAISSEKG